MIQTGFIILYAMLWGGIVVGSLAIWKKHRRRRRRFPFKDEDRFLRHPGETLRDKVATLEEALLGVAVLGYVIPPLAAFGVVVLAPRVALLMGARLNATWVIISAAAVLIVGVSAAVFFLIQRWSELTNYYLGYCGERYVAEYLRPLEREGWFVFHDVPASRGSAKFNLDHVAIGPGGVIVIETKAPRKYADVDTGGHEISFDGNLIIWPNGNRNRDAIDEVLDNAEWLRLFFRENVGQEVEIMPILTFASWCV